MNIIEKIISFIISIIITGIVIHNTDGRVSRNRYIKMEILMLLIFIANVALAFFILSRTGIPFFALMGFIINLIFIYKHMQLQVLRLHDLNYSGWYSLMSCIPFVNLYFLYLKFTKRKKLINDYDVSIDYSRFLKKSRLYPSTNLLTIDGNDFSLNDIKFQKRSNEGLTQYEVSKFSLEQDPKLKDYCYNNFKQTKNAPGYGEKYRISFLDEGNFLDKLKKDFNTLKIENGYISYGDTKIFVRENFGTYEIVYPKYSSSEIKEFTVPEELCDFKCQVLTNSQMKQFIENIVNGN